MKSNNNINTICFHASFWPAFVIVVFSIALSGVFFQSHINSVLEKELNRHELIYQLTSTAIISNIIIDNKNAQTIALNNFKSRYNLNSIHLADNDAQVEADLTSFLISNKIISYWKIPGLGFDKFIVIDSKLDKNLILTPSLLLIGIILLFIMASIMMYRRVKSQLYLKIVRPLSDTLNCSSDVLTWFDKSTAANEIVELYDRTKEFVKKLQHQRNTIEEHKINEAKYHLALQVAHDIRSPVLALQIMSNLSSELKEENKNVLINATRRISQIADSILTEHKPISLTESLPLAGIVANIVNEKMSTIKGKQISFHVYIDEKSQLALINVPEEQMNRVLSNLVDNAIEAIEDKGLIDINMRTDDTTAYLIIKDTGRGIAHQDLTRIFERGCSLYKTGGKGLGLSYAKEIIEQYGGKTEVQSTQNEGTSFCITIKRAISV